MENVQTNALILNQMNWSETSKIVTFYSHKYGLIKLIARSANKNKSPFLGILEIGQFVSISYDYKESRDLNYLKEADLIFDNVDLLKKSNAYYIFLSVIELVQKTIQILDSHPELYDDLVDLRNTLVFKDICKIAQIRFMLEYINVIGYKIDLTHCANCGSNKLTQIQFDFKTGIRCQNCLHHHVDNEFSPQIYQILIYAIKTDYDHMQKDISDHKLYLSTIRFLLLYLSYHTEKKLHLNSLEYIV